MGAVGYRLYVVKNTPPIVTNASAPAKKSPDEIRKLIVGSLKDSVKLDDQQLVEVQKIYQDQFASFNQIHNKYQTQLDQVHAEAKRETDQIHDSSVAKIRALLRPDQETLYEKWQADRAADRKRRQQRDHDHPEGKQRPPRPYPVP